MALRAAVIPGAGGTLVTSVTGTANQIQVTPTTGAVVVSLLATPMMRGTRITSTQTVTSGTVTKVQLNGITLDTGSYWDGTNFYYKPLVSGTYEVSGSIFVSGSTVTTLVASICKNGTSGSGGTEVCEVENVGLATAAAQGVSLPASLVSMNGSTDTLELDVTAIGTGTITVNAVRSASQMCIRWIGP